MSDSMNPIYKVYYKHTDSIGCVTEGSKIFLSRADANYYAHELQKQFSSSSDDLEVTIEIKIYYATNFDWKEL